MLDRQTTTQILRQHFGFDQFRPGQRQVIDNLLAGRSAAAVFPTGGGKSLCYQLPALMLPGVTLVVSPLIALMKDQIDALTARGIAARRLDSTLTLDAYRDVMHQVRAGQLRLLYVAPERFNNERFREAIRRIRIALFAVDEAHCISEWGHNFRPDYLKLAEFATLCQAERILALTATATKRVLADMCRVFDIALDCATCTGFYRPNLTVLTTPIAASQRDAMLLEQLQQRRAGPTIVYVTLQRTAEEVAQHLASAGLQAKPYHAGMQDTARAAVQEWFLASHTGIIVATIAFGMGVDKANIRYVYHYNLPKSLENYAQEIGRAGRDDATSICQMFVSLDDMNLLENFVYGDTPTLSAIRSLLDGIFSLHEEFDVSYYELSTKYDIRLLVVRTLLTYLELDRYLEGGTPFYSGYQFKPILSAKEILEQFTGDRRTFLAHIFRQARKAKTWLYIDVDQAASAIGSARDRIVRALDYLGEQRMLEVKAQGVRHRYHRLKTPGDLEALAQSLHQQATERETRDLARLQQVLELASRDGCQVSALCAHFDRPLAEPCGHCSWCLNNKTPMALPQRAVPTVDAGVLRHAEELRQTYPEALSEPYALARVLCGVTSPKLTRAKLGSQALFGALRHVPFQDVLSRVTSLYDCGLQ
ncbi:MAG: RecQ family ATP-dependent DNA helicase [Candidatus Tectomicrobia bacterium]